MAFATADDGCKLYYEVKGPEAGEGKGEQPTVVLIPGLGGDGRFWAGVEAKLKDRFRLVTVDHRGAGRCDRPSGGYTIARIARDVLAILDAEKIAAAHFVGHSTGGAVVQTIGLDAPDRALSLTISGSWAQSDARFRMMFEARAEMMDRGEATTYQKLTHVFGYTPEWIADNEESLNAAVASAATVLAPFDVAAARIRMLLAFGRAGDLGRLDLPILVVGSREDILVPFDRSEDIAARIAGARLVEARGGHFYPRTDPAYFAETVGTFLDALPGVCA